MAGGSRVLQAEYYKEVDDSGPRSPIIKGPPIKPCLNNQTCEGTPGAVRKV